MIGQPKSIAGEKVRVGKKRSGMTGRGGKRGDGKLLYMMQLITNISNIGKAWLFDLGCAVSSPYIHVVEKHWENMK